MEQNTAPKNKKILFVDDEEDLREIISFEFEMLGYQLVVAENGKVGFKLFEEEKPDLVISDIRMPGGDGIEMLKRIKARDPFTPPVLLMTGFADISDEEAYAFGADYIFAKPFDSADLVKGVDLALTEPRQRLQRQLEIPASTLSEITLPSFEKALANHQISLGRTGLFIHTANALKVGTGVNFAITFQSGELKNMNGMGIVRWSRIAPKANRKEGMGLELVHLNPEAIEVVLRHLQECRPQASIPPGWLTLRG